MKCTECGSDFQPATPSPGHETCDECIANLFIAVGGSVRPENHQPSGDVNPRRRKDFFISFYRDYRRQAEEINRIVVAHGRETHFFPEIVGAGSIVQDIQDALQNSDRIILVISPGYFDSPYCRKELETSWNLPSVRTVVFQVADCVIPIWAGGLRINDLSKLAPKEYEPAVVKALTAGDKSQEPTFLEPVHVTKVKPKAAPVALGLIWRNLRLAMNVVLGSLAVYYCLYFYSGPLDVWDAREAVTYAAFRRDISLPLNWIMRSASFSEYVPTVTPEAAARWIPFQAAASSWQAAEGWISVKGAALLQMSEAAIENGFAQFRMVFVAGTIRTMADVRDNGASYKAFRVDRDTGGAMALTFVEKLPGGAEQTLKHYSPIRVSVATTMQDFGIGRSGELYSLYRDRAILATWQAQLPAGRGGAFGLSAEGKNAVTLLRWSVVAEIRTATRASGDHSPEHALVLTAAISPAK